MGMLDDDTWTTDWAWSIPLIVINVVFHVFCLGLISEWVARFHARLKALQHSEPTFAMVMGIATTLATILHGIEAGIWAVAYRLLGAFPANKSAMLYSIGAMTTYGSSGISLPKPWLMMGALEALNGMLLFGFTTAFLFAMIQRARPLSGLRETHYP